MQARGFELRPATDQDRALLRARALEDYTPHLDWLARDGSRGAELMVIAYRRRCTIDSVTTWVPASLLVAFDPRIHGSAELSPRLRYRLHLAMTRKDALWQPLALAGYFLLWTCLIFPLAVALLPIFALLRLTGSDKKAVKVGHRAFDRAYSVSSSSPEEARTALPHQLRALLLEVRFVDTLTIREGQLRYPIAGRSAAFTERVLDLVPRLLEALAPESLYRS